MQKCNLETSSKKYYQGVLGANFLVFFFLIRDMIKLSFALLQEEGRV